MASGEILELVEVAHKKSLFIAVFSIKVSCYCSYEFFISPPMRVGLIWTLESFEWRGGEIIYFSQHLNLAISVVVHASISWKNGNPCFDLVLQSHRRLLNASRVQNQERLDLWGAKNLWHFFVHWLFLHDQQRTLNLNALSTREKSLPRACTGTVLGWGVWYSHLGNKISKFK